MSVNHSDSYNDEQQQQQQEDSSSSIRPNTLKNRIKQRAMAMESGDDDDVKDTNAKEVHISSVLAAASALASLGNQQRFTPPSTPVNSSTATSLVGGIEFDENATKSFPQKLHEILANPEWSDIITWLPNGKGFIILQKRQFAAEVMPLCFKHSKFTSFTRKLNRWNFTRVTKGPESGAYYHKYFRRDAPDLCLKMHCQSKPPPKDNGISSSKQQHGSPIKSPGVSSAMSSLKLESSSPATTTTTGRKPKSTLFSTSNPKIFAPDLTPIPESAGGSNKTPLFSTSNPKIFAPDLTRRDGDAATRSFPSTSTSQQQHTFKMQAHQAMLDRNQAMLEMKHGMLLNTNQLLLNGSCSNHNSSLANKLRHHQQQQQQGGSSFASYNSRQHPFVMQEAMNALRQKQQAANNDTLAMPTLQRRQNMPYAMTDKAYLDWLRTKYPGASENGFVSALENALGTPEHTRKMIQEMMNAQMAEYTRRRDANNANDGTRSDDAKPAAAKKAVVMNQKQVANVYGKTNKPSKEDYPKAVRRASAA